MPGSLADLKLTDAIDILLATVLVYSMVAWIRRTQAAHVAGGMLVVAAVYLTARALEMQLTVWILQGFVAIFIIVVVVLFQEEFRQLFERLATFRLRPRRRRGLALPDSDILVQCLSDFARDRIGALIVIPGTQPLGRHIRGGIEINGLLSIPLLKSLFDPHSPGHDGAVILADGRVERFAAHLPLSKDYGQLAGVGTRHGAALGLAELTDAMCLVVSEERGTISVAHRGRLRALADPQQLGQALARFYAARQPPTQRRVDLRALVREHGLEAGVSFAFIIGLWWVLIPGARTVRKGVDVPVRVVNVPAHYVLESVVPDHVQVTLSGARREFYLFDPRRLELTVDAASAKTGRRVFELTDRNLRRPSALGVEELSPSSVKISLRKESAGAAGRAPTPRENG